MDRLAAPGTPDDPPRNRHDAPTRPLLDDLATEVQRAAELVEQLAELLDAAHAETRRLREITEAIDHRVQRSSKRLASSLLNRR